jgi:hypothetical protein
MVLSLEKGIARYAQSLLSFKQSLLLFLASNLQQA